MNTPAAVPANRPALDALDLHLSRLEKRARLEGDAYWDQQRALLFEATDLAFVLLSLRNLVLILTTQELFLGDLRIKAEQRGGRPCPSSAPEPLCFDRYSTDARKPAEEL